MLGNARLDAAQAATPPASTMPVPMAPTTTSRLGGLLATVEHYQDFAGSAKDYSIGLRRENANHATCIVTRAAAPPSIQAAGLRQVRSRAVGALAMVFLIEPSSVFQQSVLDYTSAIRETLQLNPVLTRTPSV